MLRVHGRTARMYAFAYTCPFAYACASSIFVEDVHVRQTCDGCYLERLGAHVWWWWWWFGDGSERSMGMGRRGACTQQTCCMQRVPWCLFPYLMGQLGVRCV